MQHCWAGAGAFDGTAWAGHAARGAAARGSAQCTTLLRPAHLQPRWLCVAQPSAQRAAPCCPTHTPCTQRTTYRPSRSLNARCPGLPRPRPAPPRPAHALPRPAPPPHAGTFALKMVGNLYRNDPALFANVKGVVSGAWHCLGGGRKGEVGRGKGGGGRGKGGKGERGYEGKGEGRRGRKGEGQKRHAGGAPSRRWSWLWWWADLFTSQPSPSQEGCWGLAALSSAPTFLKRLTTSGRSASESALPMHHTRRGNGTPQLTPEVLPLTQPPAQPQLQEACTPGSPATPPPAPTPSQTHVPTDFDATDATGKLAFPSFPPTAFVRMQYDDSAAVGAAAAAAAAAFPHVHLSLARAWPALAALPLMLLMPLMLVLLLVQCAGSGCRRCCRCCSSARCRQAGLSLAWLLQLAHAAAPQRRVPPLAVLPLRPTATAAAACSHPACTHAIFPCAGHANEPGLVCSKRVEGSPHCHCEFVCVEKPPAQPQLLLARGTHAGVTWHSAWGVGWRAN